MKKLLIIVIAFAITFLAGCSNKSKNSTSMSAEVTSSAQISMTDEPFTTATINSDLPLTLSPVFLNIKMNAPNYRRLSKGTATFFDQDNYLIAFNYYEEVSAMDNSTINNFLMERLKIRVAYIRSGKELTKIDAEKTETRLINGVKTLNFIGKAIFVGATDKKEYPCYAFGYTFSVDGMPCQLLGIVTDEAQNQSDIDQVTKDVDGMMQTIEVG